MADPDLTVPFIQPGRYRHYKGKDYEVLGVALHSESLEPVVVYKPLYESPAQLWVRPYTMFVGTVALNGAEVLRFKRIDDES